MEDYMEYSDYEIISFEAILDYLNNDYDSMDSKLDQAQELK